MPRTPLLLIAIAVASLAACTTDNEPTRTTTTTPTPTGPTLPSPTTIGTAAIDAELDALLDQFGIDGREAECVRDAVAAYPDIYASTQTDIDQPALLEATLRSAINCDARDSLTNQLLDNSPTPLPDEFTTCVQDQLRLITDEELINALTGDPTAMATLDQTLTDTCGTPTTQ